MPSKWPPTNDDYILYMRPHPLRYPGIGLASMTRAWIKYLQVSFDYVVLLNRSSLTQRVGVVGCCIIDLHQMDMFSSEILFDRGIEIKISRKVDLKICLYFKSQTKLQKTKLNIQKDFIQPKNKYKTIIFIRKQGEWVNERTTDRTRRREHTHLQLHKCMSFGSESEPSSATDPGYMTPRPAHPLLLLMNCTQICA